MDATITIPQLHCLAAAFPPPALLDARPMHAFAADPQIIPGAIRVDHDSSIEALAGSIEPWRDVVVYCTQGHADSEGVVAELTRRGFRARKLAGGLAGWRASGGATVSYKAPSQWVTRERPKIDRIACPWLVRRFIDPAAVFHYVPPADVLRFAERTGATPFDIPDVAYSHADQRCSFDAFLALHHLDDPALAVLAEIVRAADTDRLQSAPQAAGLLAVALGSVRMFARDADLLRWGMLIYDALYTWCVSAKGESHDWNPDLLRTASRP